MLKDDEIEIPECDICNENYDEQRIPTTFACGHTSCMQCARKLNGVCHIDRRNTVPENIVPNYTLLETSIQLQKFIRQPNKSSKKQKHDGLTIKPKKTPEPPVLGDELKNAQAITLPNEQFNTLSEISRKNLQNYVKLNGYKGNVTNSMLVLQLMKVGNITVRIKLKSTSQCTFEFYCFASESVLTWKMLIERLSSTSDDSFRILLILVLRNCFETYTLETSAVSLETIELPFEMTLTKLDFSNWEKDHDMKLARFFQGCVGPEVLHFRLGNMMISPAFDQNFQGSKQDYQHIGNFMRSGREQQKNNLLGHLGEVLMLQLNENPTTAFRVSTEGTDIHWVHLRIEEIPNKASNFVNA